MSIFVSLCVLWDGLETLFLKLMFILRDGALEDGSSIHPEQRLKLTERRDLFYRTACKEIRFGRSYTCGPRVVHVHKVCMSPPPVAPSPVPEYPGDLSFVRSVKTHDTDADIDTDGGRGGPGKFCGACSKPLQGCGYMSVDGKSSFYPCCLHLDTFIKVIGEKLKLKTKNVSLKCNWCKEELIRDQRTVIPSWSYVSGGKDRRFHLDGIDESARGNEENSTANFTTYLSLTIKLPIDEKEERWADPSDSAMQMVADLIMKHVLDGNGPLTAAGDQQNRILAALGHGLGVMKSHVDSTKNNACKQFTRQNILLLLKICQGIANIPTVHDGRKVWNLIRPLLRWVYSKLCELASRMLICTSSPQGRLPHDAQAYLMKSI
ncbi:hypothetical protein ACJRO7_016493 [Eucalyptus globulus]|uniref:Uncharacterized protein n=1 Tax=Eucalyptus globulus TaxID=34317 RepID=A0ABD3LCY4_EUCGL